MGWPSWATVERWGVQWLRGLSSSVLHALLVLAAAGTVSGLILLEPEPSMASKAMFVTPIGLALATAFAAYIPVVPRLPDRTPQVCKTAILITTGVAIIASGWGIVTAGSCPPDLWDPGPCEESVSQKQRIPIALMGLWAIVAPLAAGVWAAHAMAARREDARRVGGGPGGRWHAVWTGLAVAGLASLAVIALNATAGNIVDEFDEPGDVQAVLWEAGSLSWLTWFSWPVGMIAAAVVVGAPTALRAWARDRLALARMDVSARDTWDAARPSPQRAALWRPPLWTAGVAGAVYGAVLAGWVPLLIAECSSGHGQTGSCGPWETAGILGLVFVGAGVVILGGVVVAACYRSWVQAGRRVFARRLLVDEAVDVRAAYNARRIRREEFDAWFAARDAVLEPGGQVARDLRTASWLKASVVGSAVLYLPWGLAHLSAVRDAWGSYRAWEEVASTYEPVIHLAGPAWWVAAAALAAAMWVAWRAAMALAHEPGRRRQQQIEALRRQAEQILHQETQWPRRRGAGGKAGSAGPG